MQNFRMTCIAAGFFNKKHMWILKFDTKNAPENDISP